MKGNIALFLYIIFAILLNIIVIDLAYGWSTYGAPSEFGNLTHSTCFIGGDYGIVNCTGYAYFAGIFADVTGTSNSSDYWDSLNSPADITGLVDSQISNDITSNASKLLEVFSLNGTLNASACVSWNNYSTTDEWITPSQILDVDKEDIETDLNTFVDIAGDVMTGALQTTNLNITNLANCDTIDTDASGVLSCGTDLDTTIGNCSSANVCPSIIYSNNNSWETDEAHDQCSEISNCVDNAFDALADFTGTLTDTKICVYDLANTEIDCDTDPGTGDITEVVESGTTPLTFTGCDTGSCALGMDIDGSAECAANYACTGGHTHSDIYYTETESDTNFVSRNAWTDIDSYPATCAAATPFVGTIGDTSTCRGVVSDTSPELGGYLDTAGQNIGSTTDEIENIYITTNNKIYLGTGQESEIYYDGAKLIIKVN